jgi:hypothetical protein
LTILWWPVAALVENVVGAVEEVAALLLVN